MKRATLWLVASLAVLCLTPFFIFPEIMGDVGPRQVPMWRNCIGGALLAIAAAGLVVSMIGMLRAMRRREKSRKALRANG
jgi:hypothetical protein